MNDTPNPPSGSGIESVIPFRNVPALVGYYCAVFSLVPCIALILGPCGFGFGLAGLKRAREHPEARGRVHAWIGIVLGGLTFLANAGFILLAVLAGSRR